MFRRSILYGKYYAFMHNLHRPVFVASLPDAVWSQQDTKASRPENLLCLAAVDCDELTIELNVLEGKLQFESFFSATKISINPTRITLQFLLMEPVKFLIQSTSSSDQSCVFIFLCS
jgi:hypothetical protein